MEKIKQLTNETFTALILMCQTLPAIAAHLIKSGYSFVLLGHLQSDKLEQRFGRYRQMLGANYFLGVKQVIESERKIKVINVMLIIAILCLFHFSDYVFAETNKNIHW